MVIPKQPCQDSVNNINNDDNDKHQQCPLTIRSVLLKNESLISHTIMKLSLALFVISNVSISFAFHTPTVLNRHILLKRTAPTLFQGWIQDKNGEWEWEEDDPSYVPPPTPEIAIDGMEAAKIESSKATATPTLPSGSFRPKQSLGQNFLKDGNTVAKIVRAFVENAQEEGETEVRRAVELGPGAGALTDRLVSVMSQNYESELQCIEIDPRSIELLGEKHDGLRLHHLDVLQADYVAMAEEEGGPLNVIGNLPYYITSQILFALCDASHFNAVRSATVTMQWEVAQRIVAPTNCKDYGILSVVFQLYAECQLHFKIPPTVFYPKPKVDSALVGLHFIGPQKLRERLNGVKPAQLRQVVTTAFRQRRKTVRNGLKKMILSDICHGDKDLYTQIVEIDPQTKDCSLRSDWATKRPEELSSTDFVQLTKWIFSHKSSEDDTHSENTSSLGRKVWRKMKHGTN